jgi:hypothetical protein
MKGDRERRNQGGAALRNGVRGRLASRHDTGGRNVSRSQRLDRIYAPTMVRLPKNPVKALFAEIASLLSNRPRELRARPIRRCCIETVLDDRRERRRGPAISSAKSGRDSVCALRQTA